MYIIAVYDVGEKRVVKMLKIRRRRPRDYGRKRAAGARCGGWENLHDDRHRAGIQAPRPLPKEPVCSAQPPDGAVGVGVFAALSRGKHSGRQQERLRGEEPQEVLWAHRHRRLRRHYHRTQPV